ncbi:TRAP transporter small permease [Herbiconiux liukaitaii]|uniref:TRAP transporter small permease n=1 Tax=Herbiconiux liukaitaii TaxID=3342799 RepID=UPI0035B7CB72
MTVIELTIGALALMSILVLVFFQAAQRYLPIDSVAWTGEIARFSLIWLTFSAAGLLVTSRGHITLEIVDAIPNRMMVRIIQVFALVVVAATGVGLALEAAALIQTQGLLRSPVLRLQMSWVYLPVLIGAVSTAVRAAVAAIDVAVHGPVFAQTDDDTSEGTVA